MSKRAMIQDVASHFDWQHEIHKWAERQRWLAEVPRELIMAFFQRAFEATQNPDKAWFGTHQQTASLVSGGIFIAAIHYGSAEQGAWLLTYDPQIQIEGLRYTPVRSTSGAREPLTWAYLWPLDNLERVVLSEEIWRSVGEASERILHFPIGRGREDLHHQRGKRRLSDFWSSKPPLSNQYAGELKTGVTYPRGPSARCG